MSGATTTFPIYGPLGPSDTDDFEMDFTGKLAGATIASVAAVTAAPSGLSVGTPAIVTGPAPASALNSAVAFTLSPGSLASPGRTGITYLVSVSVGTSDGRELTRSAQVTVTTR